MVDSCWTVHGKRVAQEYIICSLLYACLRYVQRALENNERFSWGLYSSNDVDKLTSLVGEDGTLLLKMMAANSNDLLVSDVMFSMLEQQRGAEAGPPDAVNMHLLPSATQTEKME